ncbi:MAG: putative glycoside hydrolase [Acidimicrobiia bacterium]
MYRRSRGRRLAATVLTLATLAWAGWAVSSFFLTADPVIVRVVDELGRPVVGAGVASGGDPVETAADGTVRLAWARGGLNLEVSADGFHFTRLRVDEQPEGEQDVVLRPFVLEASVVDGRGHPIQAAMVRTVVGEGSTDAGGRAAVRRAVPGLVVVERPGWEPVEVEWEGGSLSEVVMHPLVVRAVHLTGPAAGDRWDEFVDLAGRTELNGLMVDLKDESGLIFYPTQVERAIAGGAVVPRYDLTRLVADSRREGLYLMGRIVAFQDPIAAGAFPDLAALDQATGEPFNRDGQWFLDPTDPAAQDYALDLAREACAVGVDEVQFDYVRYPDRISGGVRFDGGAGPQTRVAAIKGFLQQATEMLHPMGCTVAADLFGFTTTDRTDGGIGQLWEEVTSVIDVASPMLYPSHYGRGWFGFDRPNDHPGPVVAEALDDGLARLEHGVVVRPWLQDFGYDADQVRAQIAEAEARGLGWMLWNAVSEFTTAALDEP